MITVRRLQQQLAKLDQDLEVTTWDGQCENSVELVLHVDGENPRVVLGMEMAPGWTLDGAKIIWAAHDVAHRGFEKAQAIWQRAKGEWVG